ncbi:MAG: hypothetical protein V3S02_04405 [Dehalococcoidales bacterium]
MNDTILIGREASVGSQAREMRVRLGLTQQELACAVGVAEKDIKLLERDVPVTLDCKRTVLKALWEKATVHNHI